MEKDWWNNLYFLPLNDTKNVADSFRGTAMKKNYRRKSPSDKPSYKLFRASLIFYFLSVIRKVSSDPLLITTQA